MPGTYRTGEDKELKYIKKVFARSLRKEQTPEELLVWNEIRNRKFMNLKFRRQHVIDGFVVDFYCHELKLAIEIDGRIHDKQKDYDDLRQELVSGRGINFIRISNDDVNRDVKLLLDNIKSYIK